MPGGNGMGNDVKSIYLSILVDGRKVALMDRNVDEDGVVYCVVYYASGFGISFNYLS